MTRVGETDGSPASAKRVMLAGSIAGLVSRFVIAPLDVVKIRLQLQSLPLHPSTFTASQNPARIYRGILPTLLRVLREESLTGLWKGNIPAELLYVTYGAAQFLTYRYATAYLDQHLPNSAPAHAQYFLAGAVSGGVATSLSYPFDLLRTRFAAQGSGEARVYVSLWHAVRHVLRDEGTSGFFRGLGAGVAQIVPYMGLVFMTHESVKGRLARTSLGSSNIIDAISGGVAGAVAKTGVFPLDLIRRRLQVQGPTRERYLLRGIPVYSGIWRTGRDVVRVEGVKGLYRGLLVSLVKAAPLSAVTMWSFEVAMRALKGMDDADVIGGR